MKFLEPIKIKVSDFFMPQICSIIKKKWKTYEFRWQWGNKAKACVCVCVCRRGKIYFYGAINDKDLRVVFRLWLPDV